MVALKPHVISIPIHAGGDWGICDVKAMRAIQDAADRAHHTMASRLTEQIWSTEPGPPVPPPSWSTRLRRRLSTLRGRVRDAWLVLIGREHVGGDW